VPPPSPRGTRSSGVVPETEEQQDIAIGAFADAEVEGEFDFASDSSDDDYQPPVSDLPPEHMTTRQEALRVLKTPLCLLS